MFIGLKGLGSRLGEVSFVLELILSRVERCFHIHGCRGMPLLDVRSKPLRVGTVFESAALV